jgi:hypothetical protein
MKNCWLWPTAKKAKSVARASFRENMLRMMCVVTMKNETDECDRTAFYASAETLMLQCRIVIS